MPKFIQVRVMDAMLHGASITFTSIGYLYVTPLNPYNFHYIIVPRFYTQLFSYLLYSIVIVRNHINISTIHLIRQVNVPKRARLNAAKISLLRLPHIYCCFKSVRLALLCCILIGNTWT